MSALASPEIHRAPARPPQRPPVLSFARTKIQPPRPRPGSLVERPAFETALADALGSATLVLLCAAAGFGKTTALTQAAARLPAGTALAWVGCDDGDAPLQLLSCLVAALEPHDLPWRIAPEALLARSASVEDSPAGRQRVYRMLVTELVNALDACDAPHGVIVVDDLHRVSHPAVYEFLDVLLERLTPRWTLALATREEPPLALARLRARGELTEFRFDALRLDAGSARRMAASAGIDDDTADALFARMHGWPAGLRLALNALSRQPGATLAESAPSIDRHLFEFLADEVLDGLPPELCAFLVGTSVLPELDAARCTALTGDVRAAQWLEAIERAGLFVTTLAAPQQTLRLHDLFRDALEHRLLRERPQALPELLRRAAASEPDGLRRLGFLLRAGDWEQAAAELHRQVPALLTAGANAAVERLIAQFPAGMGLPNLDATQVLLAWSRWRWQPMLAHARRAAEAFAAAGQRRQALAARGYALIAQAAEGLLDADGDDDGVTALEREVDSALREHAVAGDGNESGMVAALLVSQLRLWAAFQDLRLDEVRSRFERQLGLLATTSGSEPLFRLLPLPAYVGLAGMQAPLQRYVQMVQARLQDGSAHLRNLAQGLEGSLRLWAGDVGGAEVLLREALAEARWQGSPLRALLMIYPPLLAGDALAGDALALRSDARAFEDVLREALAEPAIGTRVVGELYMLGRWLLAGGEAAQALRVWRSIDGLADPRRQPAYHVPRLPLRAWIACAEGRIDDAERGFSAAIDRHGDALDLLGQASELRLRTAALRLQQGRPPADCVALLRPVLARHLGDADIAPVWLAGATALARLAGADWRSALDAEAVATLRRWQRGAAALRGELAAAPALPAERTAPTAPNVPAPERGGGLSEREHEILARMAAGDSNKLIARAFELSPHTVKRHVANILDKLDLRSRGQAAAWFHARYPVPPSLG